MRDGLPIMIQLQLFLLTGIDKAIAMQEEEIHFIGQALECVRDKRLPNKLKDVVIVDFCQNLEIQSFKGK